MSTAQLLNDPLDCVWLRQTHLKRFDVPAFKSFEIVGNEDAPESVSIYNTIDPSIFDKPVVIYRQNFMGELRPALRHN